jgi:hypothetical protein
VKVTCKAWTRHHVVDVEPPFLPGGIPISVNCCRDKILIVKVCYEQSLNPIRADLEGKGLGDALEWSKSKLHYQNLISTRFKVKVTCKAWTRHHVVDVEPPFLPGGRNAAKRTCLKQERDKEALLENVAKKST